MSQQPSRIQTRAKNSTEHPGAILTVQKRKRRTKAEMEAARAEEAAQKKAVEEEKNGRVQKVAALESQIADAHGAMDVTPRPLTRSRPAAAPLRRTETYIEDLDMARTIPVGEPTDRPMSVDDSDLDNNSITDPVVPSSEAHLSDSDSDKDITRVKKKKKKESKPRPRPKMRNAVDELRKEMASRQVSSLAEGNDTPRGDGNSQVITRMTTCVSFVVMTHGFNFHANPRCDHLVLF